MQKHYDDNNDTQKHPHKSTTPLPCSSADPSQLALSHHHKASDDHEMFQIAAQVRQISISRAPRSLTEEGDAPKSKLETLSLLSIPSDGKQYRSVVSVETGDDQQIVKDSSGSFMQDIIDTFHLAVPIFISRVSSIGVS